MPLFIIGEDIGLTNLFLRPMLALIRHDTAAPCVVRAQEYTGDARDIPIAASPPKWSPYASPLSGTAPTPHPLLTPPHGEGPPSIYSK